MLWSWARSQARRARSQVECSTAANTRHGLTGKTVHTTTVHQQQYKQVCVDPRPSDHSKTLDGRCCILAPVANIISVANTRRAGSYRWYLLPEPKLQQTNCASLPPSIDGTDRWMDGHRTVTYYAASIKNYKLTISQSKNASAWERAHARTLAHTCAAVCMQAQTDGHKPTVAHRMGGGATKHFHCQAELTFHLRPFSMWIWLGQFPSVFFFQSQYE